jgi:hypothetical protein
MLENNWVGDNSQPHAPAPMTLTDLKHKSMRREGRSSSGNTKSRITAQEKTEGARKVMYNNASINDTMPDGANTPVGSTGQMDLEGQSRVGGRPRLLSRILHPC